MVETEVGSEEWLRRLIEEIRVSAIGKTYESSDNLFAQGILDSFSAVQLVMRVEEITGITFDLNDFGSGHFRDLASLSTLFRSKYFKPAP